MFKVNLKGAVLDAISALMMLLMCDFENGMGMWTASGPLTEKMTFQGKKNQSVNLVKE